MTAASTSLLLSGIEDCIVYVPQSARVGSIQVADCRDSVLVFDCVIEGPIHLTRVATSCVVVRSALQFRMHDSDDSDVLLGKDTKGAIIENSDELIFAQCRFDDTTMISVEPFEGTVDDFDHPAGASTSWSTIDEDSTTKFTENEYVEIIRLASDVQDGRLSEDALRIKHKVISRGFDFD